MKKIKLSKFKIIAILAVALIGGVIYWAYNIAPKTNTSDQANLITYENNELKEEENGVLIWELKVGKMSVNPLTQMATIEDVKGTFYSKNGRKIYLSAALGEYNEADRSIKFTKGLKIASSDNLSFTSKEVVWDNKQRTLSILGDIEIKKPGLTAKADKATSKDNFTSFKLEGNARIIKGD